MNKRIQRSRGLFFEGKKMGLGNYLIEMADAATQTALYLERRGEFNLARFYRNASEGFKERLGDLTLEEVWNQA